MYQVGPIYGTAPGFLDTVRDMFSEAQPDKDGTYKLNINKLYPDNMDTEVTIARKVKVLDKAMLDKFVESEEGSKRLSIDGTEIKKFFNIDPQFIEVISGINTPQDVSIDGESWRSNRDNNLDNLKIISFIKTEDSLFVEDLPSLYKINNINCKYLFIKNCENIESIENITCQRSISINKQKKLKNISGTVDNFTLEEVDQDFIDRLNIKDLTIESFFTIEDFSGKSLNKFLQNVNCNRSIYVDKCDNLEELPQSIGTDKDRFPRLVLPKNLEGKLKVPDNISYNLNYND